MAMAMAMLSEGADRMSEGVADDRDCHRGWDEGPWFELEETHGGRGEWHRAHEGPCGSMREPPLVSGLHQGQRRAAVILTKWTWRGRGSGGGGGGEEGE
eukprot:5963855-Pyramimonas_sp.AAC.1